MNKEDMIKKCNDMQKLHVQVQKDTKKIKKLRNKMNKYKQRVDTLSSFYHGEWLECVEGLKDEKDIYFSILNQDSIYESITNQYQEIKKLLHKCSLGIL